MKKLAEYFAESEQGSIRPQVGDTVDIHINEELAIEAGVLESTEDKLVLEYDERGISLLEALDLVEGFTPDSFEGYVTNFEFTGDDGETQNGTLYFTANVEDGQVVVDPKSLRGESDPDYIAKVDDESATLVVQPGQIDHEYALEAAQEEAEVIWSMRDDKYAHGESVEHIDEEELDELDEGAMKNVVTDIEDAMGPTKIRYKLKQKGGKFIVSVDSNDEEDAQKALKMHPLYVAGKLRVVPEVENESALIAVDKMPKRSQAEAMADADDKFMSLLNKLLGKEPKVVTKPKEDDIIDKLRDKMSRGSTILKKEEVMAEDGDEKFTDKEIKMAFGILNDPRFKSGNMTEIVRRIEGIADGLSDHPSVKKAIQRTNEDIANEAEYQGREVKLGKPMRGDVAKYKVYVKDPKTGNVKKVNFGDKNMEIKRDDPKRRKSFRARHGCGTPKASDRTKARYWSCRMWSKKPVSKIV